MEIEYMLISQMNEGCVLHISGMMCQSILRLQDVHLSLPGARNGLKTGVPDTDRNVGIQGFIWVQSSSNVHIPYVHCMPTVSVLFLEYFQVTASGRGHSRMKKCDARLRPYYLFGRTKFPWFKSVNVKLFEVNVKVSVVRNLGAETLEP